MNIDEHTPINHHLHSLPQEGKLEDMEEVEGEMMEILVIQMMMDLMMIRMKKKMRKMRLHRLKKYHQKIYLKNCKDKECSGEE